MDLIPRSEVQILTTSLATKLNPNQLANFRVDDLQLLVERGYLNLAALEAAREEDLREAGLKTALIRILQQAGVVGAAAGPGPGSTAAASQPLAEVPCSSVMRLVDAGVTVGSCCLVSFKGRKYVLAARHCMNAKPGQPIDVTSFTVCGHKLRHVASFPKHDATMLLLDDGTELPDVLRNPIPFNVDGGVGLMRGMMIRLIGFPLAADKTIMGFEQSGIPLVAPGHVCWLSEEADEAIGSYPGGLPNCSGGAVAFGPPFQYLAGMHTSIMWHEHGAKQKDIATAADQDDASGSGSGAPAAAAAAAGGELVVETDTWSADDGATGLTVQASACGGSRKRKPASRQEGVARDCDVQYCLDNVEHKPCIGMFVPAHVLVRLLRRCQELLASARDEDRGR